MGCFHPGGVVYVCGVNGMLTYLPDSGRTNKSPLVFIPENK